VAVVLLATSLLAACGGGTTVAVTATPGLTETVTPEPIPFATVYAGLAVTAPNPYLATYRIDGRLVGIPSGRVEQAADDVRTRAIAVLGDWQAAGDLNGDGLEDRAVELVYQPAPTRVSYYVAVIVGDGRGGGAVTDSLLIGADIRIEELRVEGGLLNIRYLTRREGEPIGVTPTQRVAIWLRVAGEALVAAEAPLPHPESTPAVIYINGPNATTTTPTPTPTPAGDDGPDGDAPTATATEQAP